jgi:tetratricopeptide (TPR) repeat protein
MIRLPFIVLLGVALAAFAPAQPPSTSSSSQTQPAGRKPPEAKTQAEFKDYNAAYAVTGGAAMEKAAADFAAKYPASELRPYLYSKAMHEYQTENNAAKTVAMGEQVLALDPNDPVALALTATVLSDNLSDADPDRQKKIAEIKKNAAHALETIDTGLATPANSSPEQIAAYKNTLRSMAHAALGITALKIGDDAGAEKELKAATELNKNQPDPYLWYHLALSQDHQKKFAEALASVKEAQRYAKPEEELGKLAQGERERLELLLKQAGSVK